MKDEGLIKDIEVFGISVISGIRYSGRIVDNRTNPRWKCGLFYIWRGEAVFRDNDGKKLTVGDGGFLFLPKNKKYIMEYTAESTTFVVVNMDVVNQLHEDVSLFDDITLLYRGDPSQRIANVMAKLEMCNVSKTLSSTLRKKELVYRLLGMITSTATEGLTGEISPKIIEGVRLLEQTYLENLPISVYSDECNVSVNTFRSLFHKHFGISPAKYRIRLRIQRARELLEDGGSTVTEAAYASGFENIGYFCRCYLNLVGETPSETKRKS